ncbi:MAG: PilZ domain-containing protein [Candidatus Omnitrophica bacterium]|nr:PilZ domain-containing protein [Candidatus Omnitrophota bacterium]
MSGDTGSEKRKYLRIESRIIVKCRRHTVTSSESREKIDAVAENISINGLLFRSERKYEIGDMLEIEIDFPEGECRPVFYEKEMPPYNAPIITSGTVVRVEFVAGGSFDIGVCLTEQNDEQWLRLFNYTYGKVES